MLQSTLITLASFASLSTASYVLEDNYSGSSFFSMFSFFTGADPTNGYVDYVDQATAQSMGLINTNNGAVYMGVDSTNVATGSGRSSVRVTSNKSYNQGLIILDLEHMPGGICGTWPAFWTVGPNWPNDGEIDIIEEVNSATTNAMTLHTGPGCTISSSGTFSGSIATPNCNVNAAGQAANAGCSIDTSNTQSFGAGFNGAGGGVYATQWTSEAINIWFFPRSAIPSDITSGNPDPTGWGLATAGFSGGCDISTTFQSQQIVFDTTFCGDWAGNVWSSDPVCSSKASTCQAFVQNNPSAFQDAYWSVNSLKVYQDNGASVSTPSKSSSISLSAATPTVSAPAGATSSVQPIPAFTPSSQVSAVPSALSSEQASFSFSYGGHHTRSTGAQASFAVSGKVIATTPAASTASATDVGAAFYGASSTTVGPPEATTSDAAYEVVIPANGGPLQEEPAATAGANNGSGLTPRQEKRDAHMLKHMIKHGRSEMW